MTDNVVSMAEYRRRQDDEIDAHLDRMEEIEMDIAVKMTQSMDAHVESVAEIYDIHPALVVEYCMGGALAILGEAIREHDSGAAKDVLNWINEISGDMLDSYEVRMGRDQDERLDWRDETFRHRVLKWNEPPASDEGE